MNDPQAPLPALPEPFAPTPRPLKSPGCGRGALIGCGVIILLLGIGAVGMALNVNRMLVWILQRLEAQVETKLPADLTAEERTRFKSAFADLYRTIQEGKVDPIAVQALQGELMAMATDVDRGLTREQVLRLTEAVEKAAGTRPQEREAPGSGPPAPSPASRGVEMPRGERSVAPALA